MYHVSRNVIWGAPIASALVFPPGSVEARSNAAEWLVNEQIALGCEGDGQFTSAGVIERDLTGDGRDDLILDHAELQCASGGARSRECGFRACMVLFYVREGDLLVLKKELLSIQTSVGEGNPPVINLMSHDFSEYTRRWNGQTFE